jgi:hypothetical protein
LNDESEESKKYFPRCFQYLDKFFIAKPDDSDIKLVASMGTTFADSDVRQPRDNILLHTSLIRMIADALKK